ncbi:MAG: bacterial Ig-like domain-containing protein, partial [Acutalibacteraceae bacterium]|nr:bacterial Ig-like domain-containing protein [Acutalibacteraceae bacterium]
MRKFIKKLTACVLSLLIIFSAFSVGANAVSEGDYEYFVEDGYAVISAASDTLSGNIVIPDTLGGYPVGGIDSYAFAECKNVSVITVPDSVVALNNYAFSGCTSLNRIDLGSGLEYIGNGVFELCTSLLAIRISDNENFYIDNGALCDDYSVICLPAKSGVREFDVGNRIVSNLAFAHCEDLEYIYLGEEADLDDGEWVGTCPSLKEYDVSESNPNWSSDKNGALYDKDKTWLISYPPKADVEDIILPDTVEGMHILAFSGEYDSVLHISENLSDFFEEGKDILFKYSAFKGFEVSDYDMNFAVENGVLYTADKKTLMKYPISNVRSYFELPESTQAVYPNAFVSLDLSGNPTTEDYEQLFLRPEKLTVHTSVSFFSDYEEVGMLTNGMMGVKKICIDIADQTDDVEKTLASINNLVEFHAGYESSLDVSEEAKLSILFEVIQCDGIQFPEIVDPDTPVIPDIPVTPDEPQISYIEFETFPAKTGYVLGEAVNVDGAVLRVIYNNGTVELVSEGFTYSPLKFEKVGVNYVTVYYQGFETGFEEYVELGPPRSITVNTSNVKKEYFVGESFDEWGMSVTANYADGSTETVYGGYEIHCDEFTQAGTYTVTVEYEGCQATFDVTVTGAKMLGAYVSAIPGKVQYTVGEELDTEGLAIDVMYSDYSMKTVTEGLEVECDLSTAGTKYVQVRYTENGVTVIAEYEIEVKAPVIPANIQVQDVSVMAGETVSVPVKISNNSGLMGFSLIFKYDESVLTPVSVTAGDMLSGGSFMDSIGGTMPAGQLKVTYCGYENVSADGTLFYVNFTASENISLSSTVNVSYIQKDTFDENFDNVIFNCENFDVSVKIPDDGKQRFYSDSVTVYAGDEL